MKEIISRLISSIIIAVSILVSTKMYVDSNKYTIWGGPNLFYAATQDGYLYTYEHLGWRKMKNSFEVKLP